MTCISATYGDPRWLQREWDYHGRLCGIHPLYDERPLLYWPRPAELQNPVCLAKCPNTEDVANSKAVKLPRAEKLKMIPSDGGSRLVISQSLWVDQVPFYPTVPVLGRFCLPTPGTPLPNYGQQPSAQGGGQSAPPDRLADDTLLKDLRFSHGQILP